MPGINLLTFVGLICSFAVFPVAANAQEAASNACITAGRNRSGRLLNAHRDAFEIPGMQVAAMRNGRLIWTEGLGYANIEQRTPVTPATSFRIGSISKSLTSVAMMRLVEQGKLALDSSVRRYVPSFPEKRWPITIRQLAASFSGIRHYKDDAEASSTRAYPSVIESLEWFRNDSLLFEPGSKFGYSSPGWVLLSAALESAANKPFLQVMQDEVFHPLGMFRSGPDWSDSVVSYRATPYVLSEDDRRVPAPHVDPSSKWAAGGLRASAEDLVRFGNALLQGGFLSPQSTRTLFTPFSARPEYSRYALGWEVRRDSSGRQIVAFDGSLPSTRSVIVLYPQQQLALAVLMNTGQGVLFNQEEAIALAEQFLHDSCRPIPAAGSPNDLAGRYSYSMNFDGRDVNGIIEIFRSRGEYRGTITVPVPIFGTRPYPVVAIIEGPDGADLYAVVGNWFRIRLVRKATGLTGIWAFGPWQGPLNSVRRQQ